MNRVSIEVNGLSFNMLPVEGGHFIMGATPEQHSEAWDNESPAHVVELDDYYLGETVVTQALWNAVMGNDEDDGSEMPQTGKNWQECQSFLSRLSILTGHNFRLPTEAEWENAARGGNLSKGYKYSGSNVLEEVAWFDMNSGNRIHPVKQKLPNELGLYDMSGNVWEWCCDWYGSYPSTEEEENNCNPKGPLTGIQRVARGACCSSYIRLCRVSSRMSYEPMGKNYAMIGFRLSLDKDEAEKLVVPRSDNETVHEESEKPTVLSQTVDTTQTESTEIVAQDASSKMINPESQSSQIEKSSSTQRKKKAWPWIVSLLAIVIALIIMYPVLQDEVKYQACKSIGDYRHYVSQYPNGRHYEEASERIKLYENDSISKSKQLVSDIEKLIYEAEETRLSISIQPYNLESYLENKEMVNNGWNKLEKASRRVDELPIDYRNSFIKTITIQMDEYHRMVGELKQKEQDCIDKTSNNDVREDARKRMSVLDEYIPNH